MKLSRVYNTQEDANLAAWELMEAGFGGGRTRVVAAPLAGAEEPAGKAIVETDPAFGTARAAIAILEKRRASDTAPAVVTETVATKGTAGGGSELDDAAPFSRALGWAVLTKGDGFFSSWLNMPMLSKSATPFSDKLGMKVLLRDDAAKAEQPVERKTV